MSDDFLFGGDDNDGERDPPLTANDIKKQQRRQQNKETKKSQAEIEQLKKVHQDKQAAKKAKRGMQGKKGRQAPLAKDQLKMEEEKKAMMPEEIQSKINEQQSLLVAERQQFSILKEIKDDQNFKEFIKHFYELKKHSLLKEVVEKYLAEDDYGNTEYKLKLANPSIDRVEHLTTQMKFRLQEGNGLAYYFIGLEDDGTPLGLNNDEMKETLVTLFFMARNLNAQIMIDSVMKGIEGEVCKLEVRRNEIEGIKIDIKITMMGGEGAGKSTLIGVLISGQKDNGKGMARTNVFRHKHEVLNGRTSSISQQILGFDALGRVTNQSRFGQISWAEIVEQSSKIFTFIDVAGNEKYAKTMIKGICSHYPDYALTVIDAQAGLDPITIDHIKLAFAFNVPVIIVITKIDKVTEDQLFETQYALCDLLREVTDKIPLIISNEEDVVLCSRTIQEESIYPVFFVSNTTRKGLDLFLSFLNLLPINTQNQWRHSQDDNPEFHITETFDKDGEPILSGMVLKGQINVRQQLLLGPDNDGRFRKVEIKGIHCKRVPVRQVKAGQMCSFAVNLGTFADNWLKNCGGQIRTGMVLADPKSKPRATWTFSAEIWTFDGSTKMIKNNYQPVIHVGHIRQAAKIILDKKHIKQQYLLEEEQSTKRTANSIDDFHKSNPTSSEEEEKGKASQKFQQQNNLKQHYLSEDQQVNSNMKAQQKRFSSFKQASPLSHTDSPKYQQHKNAYKNKGEFQANQIPDKDLFEDIQISPTKKTKVIMQFLYNPEYVLKDSYIIINEQNLKAFGKITELFYDTINKMYVSSTQKAESKKKRKSSVPPQSFKTLLTGQDDSKIWNDAYESPTLTQNHRNRRTQQSHSMCITELQEESKQ